MGHGVEVFVCACTLWDQSCPQSRDIKAHLFQDDSYYTEARIESTEVTKKGYPLQLWSTFYEKMNKVLQTTHDKQIFRQGFASKGIDASFIIDFICAVCKPILKFLLVMSAPL